MKLIYYHIDELNRDSIVASGLSRICKKNNWKLILGNRNTIKLLSQFEDIFDLIVLPKPHFIRVLQGNTGRKGIRSKYLMLYTENVGILVNDKFPDLVLNAALGEDFMSGDRTYVEMVNAFCFWGVKSKNCVVSHYPELESKCFVIGHPRHDRLCMKVSNKSLDTRKNIGIVTRFNTLNDYMPRHPMSLIHDRLRLGQVKFEFFNKKTGHHLKSKRRGEDVPNDVYLDAIDFQNLYQIIKSLAEYDFNISIKIHPRENIEIYNNFFASVNRNVSVVETFTPFNHWVANQRFIIGPPSTCFYDAILMGSVPISIANLSPQRSMLVQEMDEDFNCLMPHIFAPKTIHQLIEYLESGFETSKTKTLFNDRIEEVLAQELNYPDQSNSLDKLASVIRNILDETPTSSYRIFRYTLFRCMSLIKPQFLSIYYRVRRRVTLNSTNFYLTYKIRKKIKNLT
jgi:surface carbohydrate biosynthesis protein